jgi:hypothetical protein
MRCAIVMLALIGLSSSAWATGPQPNNFTPRSANIQLARGDIPLCYRCYIRCKHHCSGETEKECQARCGEMMATCIKYGAHC